MPIQKIAPSGDLRERVTIQGRTSVTNTAGDPVQSWSEGVTVWGRMQPETPRQLALRGAPDDQVGFRLTIRYRDDVSVESRVKWRGRTFSITGLRNMDERRHYLELSLVEGDRPA